MTDLLDQFRRGKPPDKAEGHPATDDSYVAFKAVDRRRVRLKIRPANRAWERVSYNYLLSIMENGRFGTELTLIYTFMVVEIKGRHLTLIADAIDREQCEEIREFDPDYWPRPADDNTDAFIESIKIHVKLPDEDAARARADMNGRVAAGRR